MRFWLDVAAAAKAPKTTQAGAAGARAKL